MSSSEQVLRLILRNPEMPRESRLTAFTLIVQSAPIRRLWNAQQRVANLSQRGFVASLAAAMGPTTW